MYYSTNGQAPRADLRKAVVKGLAEDHVKIWMNWLIK